MLLGTALGWTLGAESLGAPVKPFGRGEAAGCVMLKVGCGLGGVCGSLFPTAACGPGLPPACCLPPALLWSSPACPRQRSQKPEVGTSPAVS